MKRAVVALLLLSLFLPALSSGATAAMAAAQEPAPERISVDFPNQDICTILRNVADLYQLNLVIPETLTGQTSIKLRNVTWRQIFHETLTPTGYTFVEDDNIIRVVSQDSAPADQEQQPEQEAESTFPSDTLIYTVLLVVAVPIILLRIILCIAVLRDRLDGGARFVPKLLWATMALLGGVLPMLAYWLMHHSTLVPARIPPVLSPDK